MLKRKTRNITISLILIGIFFPIGYMLLKKGFNNYLVERVNYSYKNSIDYKVFLKENKFFETPFLPRDDKMAYITFLIDYLDVDMNYDLVLDEKRSGDYTYSVKAVLAADTQSGDSTYWSKEYEILSPITKSFNNSSVINIAENLKINYQEYNELLTTFKHEYNLTISSNLKIYLEVATNINSNISDDVVTVNSLSSLSIPLTKATIEVPIAISAPSNEGMLSSEFIYLNNIEYLLYKIFGFTAFGLGAMSTVWFVLIFVKSGENKFNYNKNLNKILKTYDGIIVNVTQLPSLDGLKIIKVSKFNELLDAHSEVRLPINYIESEFGAYFILFNDRIAWCYTLEKAG